MSRLTEEMVIARAKQSDLSMIKKLNCWGSDLSDVSIIKRMRGVEVLALSVNKISTLSPFEECHKLQELYLRKNNITDINEIAYLQNLPSLRYLWLEENPCCELTNNYRSVVLRALPNLKKLDNVEVTQEEVDEALRGGGGSGGAVTEDELYEDAYQQQQQQQQPHTSRTSPQQMPPQQQQHSYPQHSPPTQQPQYQQQLPPQQQQSQQQQRRSSSPLKEPPLPPLPSQLASPLANNSSEGTIINHSASDLYGSQVQPAQPLHGSKPPTPTKEPVHPPSPMYNNLTKEQRTYHQYDRSPGSDQESSPQTGYREVRPTPLPPSTSTHSMKEYYQSDRPAGYPAHYRHSQTDLTEWEEHQHSQQAPQVHHNPYGSQMQLHHPTQRRSEPAYRNGSARENGGEWDGDERPRSRRPEGRFSDSTATLSASVMNHYSGYHRRPVNRSSNLLSATLCLVKELDYASLEVLEHAVRCRIDEMAGE